MADQAQPRGGDGQFLPTIANLQRDAEAARLRNTGMTFRQIAAELGIDVRQAHAGVQRAMRAVLVDSGEGEAAREAQLARLQAQLVRLDDNEQVVIKLLEKRHILVQQGTVVRLDGQPIEDDAAALACLDRLLKIEASRLKVEERLARLYGLDAPTKVAVEGDVRYEIVGVDPADLG